jgi:hypothetical protein
MEVRKIKLMCDGFGSIACNSELDVLVSKGDEIVDNEDNEEDDDSYNKEHVGGRICLLSVINESSYVFGLFCFCFMCCLLLKGSFFRGLRC